MATTTQGACADRLGESGARGAANWRSQFGCPTGWLGWLIGHLMAVKNKERSLWVLSLLELRPQDRVLEIGFGSGADVRRVSERVAFAAGVDHSELMVAQARRRNRAGVVAGRVDLRLASSSSLPFADAAFDKAFAINAAQFWKDVTGDLRELRRVLKPGGLAAIAVQPRSKGATEETAAVTGERLAGALCAAGFRDVQLETRKLRPVSVVCSLGRK
jgi:ubiquinone/menaquinone biosynthesis C-methylase UbiE